MEPVEPRIEIFFNKGASVDTTRIFSITEKAVLWALPNSLRASEAVCRCAKATIGSFPSNSSHDEPLKIVPDCGGGKNESIDAVKHSAVSRKQRTGIPDAGAALKRRLEHSSDLARNASEGGHREHVRRPDLHPISEYGSDEQ